MKTYVTYSVPKTIKEIKKLDLNTIRLFQNNSFSPNRDCHIMSFTNMPLNHYLKEYAGKDVLITIEEKPEVKQ